MKRYIAGFLVCAAVSAAGIAHAQNNTKYGVTVTADKSTDFSRFKTYAWTQTRPSSDKTIDAQVIAAVDHELGALGMTKAASGKPDVLVSYSSLSRSDVDVTGKADARGARPQYAVGTLVVGLLDATSRKELLRLRADKPIESTQNLEPVIKSVVAEMFEKYPTKTQKK